MIKYRFSVPRYEAPDLPEIRISDYQFVEPEEEESQEGIIQGQKSRSTEEWRVAQALWTLELEFIYQYPLFGGTSVRGGYVLDFLVDLIGVPTPLEVQSQRWHSGRFAREERLRAAIIERIFGVQMKFVWDTELTIKGEALIAVREALYKPQARRL